jgi:heme A synthase
MDVNVDLVENDLPAMSIQRRPSISIHDKLGIIFGRHLLYSTLVTCVSVFTLNFLFYGGLYAFPQVLPDLKLNVTPSANLMLGALVEVPGFLGGIMIGNYLSRKNCMLVYLLAVIVFLCVFSFTSTSISGNFTAEFEALVQVGLIGSKLFTAVGFLIVYVYTTEIYPTVVRTMGGALCIAFGRFGSIVAPTVYENLAFATGSHGAFFHVTAGLCALNAMLVLFLPYETKGLVLQDHIPETQPLNDKSTIGRMP